MRHSDLSKYILKECLKLPFADNCYLWSNPSGRRGRISFGKKGSSDIIGFNKKTGSFIGIELKQPKEPFSSEQIKFRDMLVSTKHGMWFQVGSESEALEALKIICGL